jgi:hypothetical protein
LVDTHFYIPITAGDEYYENRQAVLMAINRAVKKHGVPFAELVTVSTGLPTQWRVVPDDFVPDDFRYEGRT